MILNTYLDSSAALASFWMCFLSYLISAFLVAL
jgi:hypothetical protein